MALPSSGAISLNLVNVELSLTATAQVSLNDTAVRTLFGVASGAISMSNGYGKSSVIDQMIIAGGYPASYAAVTTTNKFLFATEAISVLSSAPMPAAAGNGVQIGNKTYGYSFGGIQTGGWTYTTQRSRFNHSTLTWNSLTALTTQRIFGGSGNISDRAYSLGGSQSVGGLANDVIQKFVFSTETTTSISATLPSSPWLAPGTIGDANRFIIFNSNNGYACAQAWVQLSYSTEARTNGASLASTRDAFGTGQVGTTTTGYVKLNGLCTAASTALAKFTFASDAVASATSLVSYIASGTSSSNPTKGIWVGGWNAGITSAINVINKMTFSGETTTNLSATLGTAVAVSFSFTANPGWY